MHAMCVRAALFRPCDVRSHFSTLLHIFCDKNGHIWPEITIYCNFLRLFKLVDIIHLHKYLVLELNYSKVNWPRLYNLGVLNFRTKNVENY